MAGITTCRGDLSGTVSAGEKEERIYTKDLISGRFQIIHAHPEALFHTSVGEELLDSNIRIGAVVIDECHIVEEWYAQKCSSNQCYYWFKYILLSHFAFVFVQVHIQLL